MARKLDQDGASVAPVLSPTKGVDVGKFPPPARMLIADLPVAHSRGNLYVHRTGDRKGEVAVQFA